MIMDISWLSFLIWVGFWLERIIYVVEWMTLFDLNHVAWFFYGYYLDVILIYFDVIWYYLDITTFFPQLKTVSYEKSDDLRKKISKNMTSSRASKSAACQKHDFFCKYIDPALRFMLFFFSGKNSMGCHRKLGLVYIYIICMDFDSLFFFGRWIAVLSALGQWFLYKLMVSVGHFSIAKDSGERGSFLCSTWYEMQS